MEIQTLNRCRNQCFFLFCVLPPILSCDDDCFGKIRCRIKNSKCPILGSKVRLSQGFKGNIQVYNVSKWKRVKEGNWDINKEKMLCHHLGFNHQGRQTYSKLKTFKKPGEILSGDLLCYAAKMSKKTSCCFHLTHVPITSGQTVEFPFVQCEYNDNTYSNGSLKPHRYKCCTGEFIMTIACTSTFCNCLHAKKLCFHNFYSRNRRLELPKQHNMIKSVPIVANFHIL